MKKATPTAPACLWGSLHPLWWTQQKSPVAVKPPPPYVSIPTPSRSVLHAQLHLSWKLGYVIGVHGKHMRKKPSTASHASDLFGNILGSTICQTCSTQGHSPPAQFHTPVLCLSRFQITPAVGAPVEPAAMVVPCGNVRVCRSCCVALERNDTAA